MTYNAIAFIAAALLVVLFLPGPLRRIVPLAPRLLVAALLLRIIGSTARYEVIFRLYEGRGDSVTYHSKGLEMARQLWDLDLSVLGLGHWFGGPQWWGTPFMDNLAGLTAALVGPSLRSHFLLFSLIALLGLFAILKASYRTLSVEATGRFALWALLWPSLWFWPSSVGKEAVTLLAIGLATLGYAGRGERIYWMWLAAGVALGFAVRPHVAVVLAFAAIIGHWLGRRIYAERWRVLEVLVLFVLFVFALRGMTAVFGDDTRFQLEDPSIAGFSEFVGYWNQQTVTGGSSIGAVPAGILGIPAALLNVWVRPFPWEVHNLTALVSAVEIIILWWLIWKNRIELKTALRHWRENRLIRFALPLLLLYTLMIGLTFGNLGIIARQRTPVFPFLLLLIVCVVRQGKGAVEAESA